MPAPQSAPPRTGTLIRTLSRSLSLPLILTLILPRPLPLYANPGLRERLAALPLGRFPEGRSFQNPGGHRPSRK